MSEPQRQRNSSAPFGLQLNLANALVVAVTYSIRHTMNDKLSSHQNDIRSRHLQHYTLGMLQLWLKEEHGISVCLSTISRSICRALKQPLLNYRAARDEQYNYYRDKVNAGLQHKKYKRYLNQYLGLIEHYRYQLNDSARTIRDKLKSQGIETSLNSVYRALALIDEQRKKVGGFTKNEKNICKPENPGQGIKQSDVQRESNSWFRNIPQL